MHVIRIRLVHPVRRNERSRAVEHIRMTLNIESRASEAHFAERNHLRLYGGAVFSNHLR